MEIITGYKAMPHVTAEQDRAVNQGIFGEGSFVLNVGQKMRAEIASNTEVRIHDGVISHQGCTAVIRKNAYDSVSIANGSQGMRRKDLIVARYTRDAGSGVEDITWHVIQGTPKASSPVKPTGTTGDIQSGDTMADMEMFVVNLNGINIESIETLFSVHTFKETVSADNVTYSGTVSGSNVKAAIDNLNAKVVNRVERVKITATSISGDSGSSKTYTCPTKSGFKPVGVVGWYVTGERASQITFPNMYMDGQTLHVYIKNAGSGTVSLTADSFFDVLYIRS